MNADMNWYALQNNFIKAARVCQCLLTNVFGPCPPSLDCLLLLADSLPIRKPQAARHMAAGKVLAGAALAIRSWTPLPRTVSDDSSIIQS